MPANNYQQIKISTCFGQARQAEDRIIELAGEHGYNDEDIFALRLSLEEALTNAVKHGNRRDQSKFINIRYCVNHERVDIYIADEGEGFDPLTVPDPTRAENLELPSGRGLMLMKVYMDSIEFNQAGNEVHMIRLKETSPVKE